MKKFPSNDTHSSVTQHLSQQGPFTETLSDSGGRKWILPNIPSLRRDPEQQDSVGTGRESAHDAAP